MVPPNNGNAGRSAVQAGRWHRIAVNNGGAAFMTPPVVAPGVVAFGTLSTPAYGMPGLGLTTGAADSTPRPEPRLVTFTYRNTEVLAALQKLTGQDFDYDVAAWRRWVSREYNPTPRPGAGFRNLDVRRGRSPRPFPYRRGGDRGRSSTANDDWERRSMFRALRQHLELHLARAGARSTSLLRGLARTENHRELRSFPASRRRAHFRRFHPIGHSEDESSERLPRSDPHRPLPRDSSVSSEPPGCAPWPRRWNRRGTSRVSLLGPLLRSPDLINRRPGLRAAGLAGGTRIVVAGAGSVPTWPRRAHSNGLRHRFT